MRKSRNVAVLDFPVKRRRGILRDMLNVGVLGSGRGSNLQSILDAVAAGRLAARVRCVIADYPDAFILERARQAGVPAFHVDGAPFKTKLDGGAEAQVIDLLRRHGVDTVALAGFMRIVKPGLLSAFPHRVINIHPSLLPAFPGLSAWKQAVAYGARVSGCTVHFVDAGMDTGPIIVQRAVPVLPDDTPEMLHARIQEQEHLAYPEALALLAAGRLRVDGRRVLIQAAPPHPGPGDPAPDG
jgi:phosphoribosylglycinamide formyltransferase-1